MPSSPRTRSASSGARGRRIENKDFVLLGIKYEAARLGGVDGDALAKIEEQIRSEAGDGWRSDPAIVRGRNAVRVEHDLLPLGEPARHAPLAAAKPSLWGRLFGGR